jgi:hypothetical protein
MFDKKPEKLAVTRDGKNFPDVRKLSNGQVKIFREKGFDPAYNKELIRQRAKLGAINPKDIKDENEAFNIINNLGVEVTLMAADLQDKAHWWILENVYSDLDFDDADFQACKDLTRNAYNATFGTGEEIKNS